MPRSSTTFRPGQSGNPKGRPKEIGEFRELCREKTNKAVRALENALGDPERAPFAAKTLLEFGWGKAPQEIRADVTLQQLTDEQLEARFRELVLAAGAQMVAAAKE